MSSSNILFQFQAEDIAHDGHILPPEQYLARVLPFEEELAKQKQKLEDLLLLEKTGNYQSKHSAILQRRIDRCRKSIVSMPLLIEGAKKLAESSANMTQDERQGDVCACVAWGNKLTLAL